jgi:hypothetical protein
MLSLLLAAAATTARADEMLLWDNYPGDVLQDVTFNMSSERNTQVGESTWVVDDVELAEEPGKPGPASALITRLEWVGAFNDAFTYSKADVILLNSEFQTVLELSDLDYTIAEVHDDPGDPYYNPSPDATTYVANLEFDDPIAVADLGGTDEPLERFYVGVRLVGDGFFQGRNYFVTSSVDTTFRGSDQGYIKAATFSAPDWRPASDVWYGTPDGTRAEKFEFAFRLYAIPEPASVVLLALGSVALLSRRR